MKRLIFVGLLVSLSVAVVAASAIMVAHAGYMVLNKPTVAWDVSAQGAHPAPPIVGVPPPPATSDTISYNGVGPTTISLTWAKSGDLCFDSYYLQYSTAGSNGPWTTLATITTAADNSTYVYGLSPSVTYWWQIVDNSGCFGGSADSNALQVTQSAPATLSASQLTSTSAEFAWTNDADYGGYVAFDSYQLMESVNGGAYAPATTISTETATSYTLNGLSSGTTYYFYVITTDECSGSGCSGETYPSASNSNVVSIGTPTTLSAAVAARPSSVDVGQYVAFSCTPAGGEPPYSYSWSFGDGTSGSGPSPTHQYDSAGSFDAICTVTDSYQTTAAEGVAVTVASDPTVATPIATRTSADVGQPVTFTTSGSGGAGGLTYAWSGLPPGCSGMTEVITCSPSAPVNETPITVTVTDANGFSVVSQTLMFTVYSDPATTAPTASPITVQTGNTVTFTTSASGGSGGYSYSWDGLPSGCLNANSPFVTCNPSRAATYSVTVTVTDSNGISSTSVPTTFTVTSPPATVGGVAATTFYIIIGVVIAAIIIGVAVAFALRRRPPASSAPPPAPPSPPANP